MSNGFTLQVDRANPGEVLACCGALELSHRVGDYATGRFDGNTFVVASTVMLAEVLHLLVSCSVRELDSVAGVPVKPLIAPLELTTDHFSLTLDAWVQVRQEKGQLIAAANRPWNFWSGQQTSMRIWTALQAALRRQLDEEGDAQLQFILQSRVPLTGRFGFDPGAAWNALDAGFSPNEQGMSVASSPALELLAAIGLQRFRPDVERGAEGFPYHVWSVPLPPAVAAAAYSGALPDLSTQSFRGPVTSRGSYAALGYATSTQWRTA